jgi:hypothetical protein
VHEVDGACETTQLRNDLRDKFWPDKRLWFLLPEVLQVAAVRPVGQYDVLFAKNHSCHPAYEMGVVPLAQLAEVLRFCVPCAVRSQALGIVYVDVLERFDRHVTRFAALCITESAAIDISLTARLTRSDSLA